LLKNAIIAKWIARVHPRRFLLINERNIFRAGHAKIHPISDEIWN